jgi:tripartite-type tricarboxylate transporter receptor subunit TctC
MSRISRRAFVASVLASPAVAWAQEWPTKQITMVVPFPPGGSVINHVAYRGGGPAVNDAVGGHIDLVIGSVALQTPQVQGGTLRPIVQTGKTRLSALPNVPTVGESGFAGVEASAWWGVFAPKGTPAQVMDRFRAALVGAIQDEKVAKQMTDAQQITLRLGGPDVLRPFLAEQIRIWGDVVRENNIKAAN